MSSENDQSSTSVDRVVLRSITRRLTLTSNKQPTRDSVATFCYRAKHMADFSRWDRANLEAVASDMLQRILKDTATSESELLPVLDLRSKLEVGKSSQISDKFRIGVAIGLCVGCALASFGWVAFFWLASLSR